MAFPLTPPPRPARCRPGRSGLPFEAALSIGSNVGDRAANCLRAVERLSELPGVTPLSRSSLYSTVPVGVDGRRRFINLAALIRTSLAPMELLRVVKGVELDLGRHPDHARWGDRPVDVDIVFYGMKAFATPGLIIPHPLAHERAFVMLPLAEIAPGFVHPLLGETVAALAARVGGRSGVERFSP